MTERDTIHQFLTNHPEWTHAYRTIHPGKWIQLKLDKHDPYHPHTWQPAVKLTSIIPIKDVHHKYLVIPPDGQPQTPNTTTNKNQPSQKQIAPI